MFYYKIKMSKLSFLKVRKSQMNIFFCLQFLQEPTIFFPIYAPASKKWSNQKKMHFYFFDSTNFERLGQKLVFFFVGILEELKTRKNSSEISSPLVSFSIMLQSQNFTQFNLSYLTGLTWKVTALSI